MISDGGKSVKTFSDMKDYEAYIRPGGGFVVMRKEI